MSSTAKKSAAWYCKGAIEITSIDTIGSNYLVTIAETGKQAYLPIEWTEVVSHHVIIPLSIIQRLGLTPAK